MGSHPWPANFDITPIGTERKAFMSVALGTHEDGVLLPVQAQPKARKNGVTGEHDGALKVAVTQAPEKGKANEAILKVLADELGLKRAQIKLLSGETSTKKKFIVSDVTADELNERIETCLRKLS